MVPTGLFCLELLNLVLSPSIIFLGLLIIPVKARLTRISLRNPIYLLHSIPIFHPGPSFLALTQIPIMRESAALTILIFLGLASASPKRRILLNPSGRMIIPDLL